MSPVALRPATSADVPGLAELDAASFGNPWPADIWMQEVERDLAHVTVAIAHDPLLGLVGSSCLWVVREEAHLLRIATRPTFRGRGIGRDLLEDAFVSARAAGCSTMLLEVARRNRAALALYERAGFQIIGERKGYYTTPPDDALLMRRSLVVT